MGGFGFWPCCSCNCNEDLASLTWRLELEGIADGTGSNCDEFNGTHDITIASTEDSEATSHPLCEACFPLDNTSIYLSFQTSGSAAGGISVVTLEFFNNTTCTRGLGGARLIAEYQTAFTSETCNSNSITLTLGTDFGDCTGWPSSITIHAIESA